MTMLPKAALGLVFPFSLSMSVMANASPPPDGIHDRGFGADGVAMASFGPHNGLEDWTTGIAVAPSGRIYLSATTHTPNQRTFGLVRFFLNGQLDPAFSGDGVANPMPPALSGQGMNAEGVVVRADGRPLVYGRLVSLNSPPRMVVCRYAVAGNLDQSYDGDGCAVPTLALIDNGDEGVLTGVRLPNEHLMLGGYAAVNPLDPEQEDGLVVAIRDDGAINAAFGSAGYVLLHPPGSTVTRVTNLLRQNDGRLVAVGITRVPGFPYRIFATRLTTTGQIDTSFGVNGYAQVSFEDLHILPNANESAHGAAIDSQGRIHVCGSVSSGNSRVMAFARLGSNGMLDPGFSTDGRVMRPFIDVLTSSAVACAVDAQDRLVAAVRVAGAGINSNADFGAIRFTPDGVEDARFNHTGQTRVGIDLGGPGTGDDSPAALAIVGGDVLIAGTSIPETGGNSANEVQTIVRLGSDRMFASSFEE